MAKKKVVGKDEWKHIVKVARDEMKLAKKRLALLDQIITFEGVPTPKELRNIDAKIDDLFLDEELYYSIGDLWAAYETAENEATNSDNVANNS